jgi:hypothetical protein
VKIVGLSFGVSDRQGEFLRTAELFEHGAVELGVDEAGE